MNTREQLNQYLRALESRLRLLVVSRGVAVAFGVALGATVALVLITNAFAFSTTSMVVARIALYISLAVAVGLGLVIPLMKLNQRRAAGKAEQAHPPFQQRLVTYIERREQQDPMLELLAEDTLTHAPQAPASMVIPQKSLFAFGTSAGAALAVLMWLILAEGGFMHFGARTLWAGLPKEGQAGFYRIVVEPGDATLRRRTDQPIVATLEGFNSPEVKLMVKYESSAKWEEIIMLPRPGDSSYGFLIAAVPEGLQYYVEAAGVKSKAYNIKVVDLPGVKNIKVTYHFPAWLGQKDLVEDPGGDLRAVIGTIAELTVETDRPLSNGIIEMQDGKQIEIQSLEGNMLTVRVPVEKDGVYHFSAKNGSEIIRLSQDYFIEAQMDEGPKVKISHPGPDAKVNPVEEVIVKVEADDDYGLTSLKLHYSVNGQAEKVIDLLAGARGGLVGNGTATIYLEDFHLVPGDVVSLYATAKDARVEAASEINFIEAQPYEKNYSQSQQGGGGGGGGGGGQQEEQNEISRRQREIISLTHKALRGNPNEKAAATKERAEFLAEVQNKLKDQAASLANRIKARELDGESSTIGDFVKEIEAAASEMAPAATMLGGSKWQDALIPEQKALQHLQRAEQMNRDIQVAFGNQGGGGGGGGGGNAGRDLANLFDLELDTEKNQYEQSQQAEGGGGGSEQQKEVDAALEKLKELAKRQEQLAQQANNNKTQSVDRRWEQEQLRREAEELKKKIEQLQQQQQAQQGQQQRSQQSQISRGQGQQSQGQSGGQQDQSGQQQSQSGQQQAQNSQQGKQQQQNGQQQQNQQREQQQLKELLDRVNQAQQDMRDAQRASSEGKQGEAEAAARRAAERLNDASKAGNQLQRQGVSSGLDGLEQRAEAMAREQAQMENQMKSAYAAANGKQGVGLSKQERDAMAAEKDEMRKELQQLERDAQRQARDLTSQQPDASRLLREGLGEVQQSEAERRLEYGADYLRRATPQQMTDWVSRERALTQALESMRDSIDKARRALKDGDQQNAGQSDLERQVAGLERTRAQLERALAQQGQNGQGKQGGQQPGQGKDGQQQANGQQPGQGKDGQGKDGQDGKGGGQGKGGQDGKGGQGQTSGNQEGGGGNQNGGAFGGNGGPYGGNNVGAYDRFGRYNPQGLYDPRNTAPVDPQQVLREAARDLASLRQSIRDNRDLSSQAAALERQIQDLTLGNPSGSELQERLGRTILPQLETLEVGMRQELAKTEGQVRSASTDRTPVGFAESVQEYFRKLSRSK